MPRSLLAIALIPVLVSCGDPVKPLKPDGSARPYAVERVSAQRSASATSSAAPLSSAEAEEPACSRAKVEQVGEWRASASDVRAAIKKTDFCAPADWLADELTKCMQELGQLEVTVRYGVMGGEGSTPNACDVSVGAAEWNGRKWVTFNSDLREGHTFFEYVTAIEMKANGPLLSTNGCQRLPSGEIVGTHPPLVPHGWHAFPEKLKARLCF